MKKLSYSIIIILCFCAVLSISILYAKRLSEFKKQTQAEISLPVRVVTVLENTKLYDINFEYPQFGGQSFTSLNADIKKEVDAAISDFKQSVKENWDARKETASKDEFVPEYPDIPFALSGNWIHDQINNSYISMSLKYGGFTGGAHGFEVIKSFNFDVYKKQNIILSEALGKTINQEVIDSVIDQVASSTNQEKDAISDVITKEFLDNFSNFTFTNDQVILHFNQYEVGPYVVGMPEAIIYKK